MDNRFSSFKQSYNQKKYPLPRIQEILDCAKELKSPSLTIEMLEKTSDKPKVETSNLQDKFRDLAEKKIYNLAKEKFYSHGNISSVFLEKNNKYL